MIVRGLGYCYSLTVLPTDKAGRRSERQGHVGLTTMRASHARSTNGLSGCLVDSSLLCTIYAPSTRTLLLY